MMTWGDLSMLTPPPGGGVRAEFDPGFNARQYTKFWRLKLEIYRISIPYSTPKWKETNVPFDYVRLEENWNALNN